VSQSQTDVLADHQWAKCLGRLDELQDSPSRHKTTTVLQDLLATIGLWTKARLEQRVPDVLSAVETVVEVAAGWKKTIFVSVAEQYDPIVAFFEMSMVRERAHILAIGDAVDGALPWTLVETSAVPTGVKEETQECDAEPSGALVVGENFVEVFALEGRIVACMGGIAPEWAGVIKLGGSIDKFYASVAKLMDGAAIHFEGGFNLAHLELCQAACKHSLIVAVSAIALTKFSPSLPYNEALADYMKFRSGAPHPEHDDVGNLPGLLAKLEVCGDDKAAVPPSQGPPFLEVLVRYGRSFKFVQAASRNTLLSGDECSDGLAQFTKNLVASPFAASVEQCVAALVSSSLQAVCDSVATDRLLVQDPEVVLRMASEGRLSDALGLLIGATTKETFQGFKERIQQQWGVMVLMSMWPHSVAEYMSKQLLTFLAVDSVRCECWASQPHTLSRIDVEYMLELHTSLHNLVVEMVRADVA
jgi:hypothetical protein